MVCWLARLSCLLSFFIFSRAVLILSADDQPKFRNPLQIPPVLNPNSSGVYVSMVNRTLNLGLWTTDNRTAYTEVWTYSGTYPGPTFVVHQSQAIRVWWDNNLPSTHLLANALDPNLDCGRRVYLQNRSYPKNCTDPAVRTVVHLHGARVEDTSDGYPEAWWDNSKGLRKLWSGPFYKFDTFTYLNEQEAATLWYHDHAVGVTRLNVYTGLLGFYIIQDDWERSLPLPQGDFDIPLVIQDKNFTRDGQLQYDHDINPITGEPLAKLGVAFPFILVNGVTWPYLNVKQTAYRFRLLNGCDGRFLNLSLSMDIPVWQIGIDQGLLDAPVRLKFYNPSNVNEGLFFGPAERREIIINFTDVPIGTYLNLTNFPNEDSGWAPISPPTAALIMQFRVVAPGPPSKPLPSSLRQQNFSVPVLPPLTNDYLGIAAFKDEHDANSTGLQLGVWNFTDINGSWSWGPRFWDDPVSEFFTVGTTRDWWICKHLGGLHPIHVHWLEFQVLGRWSWSINGGITGALPLFPGDFGPKDMVIARPETCVQIRLLFNQTGRFIWHCHILSHEDHDMMRPLQVLQHPLLVLEAQTLARQNIMYIAPEDNNLGSLEDEAMAQRFNYSNIADDWDGRQAITELAVIAPPPGPPGSYSQQFVSAHAVLMALTFGLIFPIGAALMRHGKGRFIWAHAGVQLFGLAMLLTAAVIAYSKLKSDRDDFVVRVHRALGITIFTVPWINPITGYLLHRQQINFSTRNLWQFFLSKMHTWPIRCIFVLAVAQIPVGIYITGTEHKYVVAYVVLIAVMAAFLALLELINSYRQSVYPAGARQDVDLENRRNTSSS